MLIMLIIQACFLLLGMYRNFLSFSWFIIYDMGTFYESLENLHFNATLIFFLSLVFIEELCAFFSKHFSSLHFFFFKLRNLR